MQERIDEMIGRVTRHFTAFSPVTALPGLGVSIVTAPSAPLSTIYRTMICVVLQGAKQVMIGDRVLRYDPACSFLATLELAATGCVIEASADHPYIGISLAIDRAALAQLIVEMPASSEGDVAGYAVTPMTPDLLDAWAQYLALLDTPLDIPVLAPLREREILYRLLRGPHGGVLRQIACEDSRLSRVRRAIDWIRAHFDQPVRVETLAEIAGMSIPSLHRHFKAATEMSPLQYQKALRLVTARRLLIANNEAGRAAYSVGYESVSQFSREYARMFGAPPSRDAERLRALPEIVAAAI